MARDDYPSDSSPLEKFVVYFRRKGPSSAYAEARELEKSRFRKKFAEWRKHYRPTLPLSALLDPDRKMDPAAVTEWNLIQISADFVMEDCLSCVVRLRAEDREPSEARQLLDSQIPRTLDFIYKE